MNNQHFSTALQKDNPAALGFSLNFAATDQNQSASFATGFAELKVSRVPFGVSGINFSGLNVLTDTDAQSEVRDQVNFNVKISGGVPGAGGFQINNSGAVNVEKILVFTGDSEFDSNLLAPSPDYADFTLKTQVDENLDINFSLTKEDLASNTGVIFYRLLPVDRIASGQASEIISGQLFTGFLDLPQTFTSEIFISRSNLNDVRFRANKLVLSDGATGIGIDKEGIVSDFACAFDLRTDQEVVITGIDGTGIDGTVTFVFPPDVTTPTTGVTMSGNFTTFSLEKDVTIDNNYIVRKSEG
jgi:hypothetical protein